MDPLLLVVSALAGLVLLGRRRRAVGRQGSGRAAARSVLGVGAMASRDEIEGAWRARMREAHPDHGGSPDRAAALNAARDELLKS